jgi:hypothetical protein
MVGAVQRTRRVDSGQMVVHGDLPWAVRAMWLKGSPVPAREPCACTHCERDRRHTPRWTGLVRSALPGRSFAIRESSR